MEPDLDPIRRPGYRVVLAVVVDGHLARAVRTLGDGPGEVDVAERVVRRPDGEPALPRPFGQALRHGPRDEDAIALEPDIVMVRPCPVVVDDEPGHEKGLLDRDPLPALDRGLPEPELEDAVRERGPGALGRYLVRERDHAGHVPEGPLLPYDLAGLGGLRALRAALARELELGRGEQADRDVLAVDSGQVRDHEHLVLVLAHVDAELAADRGQQPVADAAGPEPAGR